MELTSEELRAQVEAVLRTLAAAPYLKTDDGEYFLSLVNPNGASGGLHFKEMEGEVELQYGPGGGKWYFYSTDKQGRDNFTEENLKDTLKDIVKNVRGILDETMFSAYYKRFFIPIGGFYPVSEFEDLRTCKKFESVSWNGTYSIGGEAEAK